MLDSQRHDEEGIIENALEGDLFASRCHMKFCGRCWAHTVSGNDGIKEVKDE